MEFEFDPDKSKANLDKHGIDFVEAQIIWDRWAAEKPLAYAGEARRLRIGWIRDKLWSVVFTMRGDSIRLISARRTRDNEVIEYEHAARQQTRHDTQP
jgi:uncharacterized protein